MSAGPKRPGSSFGPQKRESRTTTAGFLPCHDRRADRQTLRLIAVTQDTRAKHRTIPSNSLREGGWFVSGSIFQRGPKWVLKVPMGRENGKKRDKWLTFTTRREAEEVQRELASHTLAHSAGVGLYGNSRERLGSYLVDWLKRQKPRLAPRTQERYDSIVSQVRRDVIGGIPLARLAPRALEGCYARKLDAGLAPATALYHHRVMHKALRDALRQDIIVQNPAALAIAPRAVKTHPDVWTEAQTLLFLSEAKASSRFYPTCFFAVGTGARQGEVLGLSWRSLDVEAGTASVTHTLQWRRKTEGGGYTLKEPKTPHSRRSIALPPEIVDELRAVQQRQDEERRRRDLCPDGAACRNRYCRKWHETGLVFTLENGKAIHKRNLHRDMKDLCENVGLPWRRAFHGLRHAHASYLLARQVPVKVVQERLGHATAAFTLGTYAHVLVGMQDQAVRATSEMLQVARK